MHDRAYEEMPDMTGIDWNGLDVTKFVPSTVELTAEHFDDIDDMLAERRAVINQNGEYDVASAISQAIKTAVKDTTYFGGRAPDYMLEAIDMIANKLARIACGDPYHLDHWKDIAGYAKLVMAQIEKK